MELLNLKLLARLGFVTKHPMGGSVYLGQASIETTTNQIQGLVDIFSNAPLPVLLLLLGIVFILFGVASGITLPGGFSYQGGSVWLFIIGLVLFVVGLITHPQVEKLSKNRNTGQIAILRNDANGLMRVQDYEEAIQVLKKLTKAQPRDPWAWSQLALAFRRQEDFEQALEANEEAIKIKPDYSYAWVSRARILLERAKTKGGIRNVELTQKGLSSVLFCLDEAIRSNKGWESTSLVNAFNAKGHVLAMLDRNQEARGAFESVLKIDPSFNIPDEVRRKNGMPLNTVVTQPSGEKDSIQSEQPADRNVFNTKAIYDQINRGTVLFYSSDGSTPIRGQIASSEIRERQILEESGVTASITWNDGITSSILFMQDSKVRVWSEGVEYGGSWYWGADDLLEIRMNGGAKYQFGK